MFTGIINHIGDVDVVSSNNRVYIDSLFNYVDVAIGDSIACDGICLTIVEKGVSGKSPPILFKRWFDQKYRNRACWFAADLSPETIERTNVKRWLSGDHNIPVNLERSLRLGDRLNGHLVSGHIDGLAIIETITPNRDSYCLILSAPPHLSRFIAEKGSVTLDGISLTVNKVEGHRFQVNIIPHTWQITTLHLRQPGDALNLEVDMVARYIARIMASG